ncbi:MAG: serine/threonine-protein kinase, partial [Pseudomonadota bacterium]
MSIGDQIPYSQDDIDEVFFDALEVPEAELGPWLTRRCKSNQALIEEIRSLLVAHGGSGQFLQETNTFSSQVPTATDYSGTTIGPWRIKETIGSGGMGSVYLGERCDGAYQQTVAVKIGSVSGVNSALLQRERQALAEIDHPAITRIIDAGDIDNSSDAYLVMEHVEGETLTRYLERKRVSKTTAASIMCSILEVLHIAHEKGVVHCDIKPANLMISVQGQARLLDFGISRVQSYQQLPDDVHGITPDFASPQRLQGAAPTAADDIYSCGLLFKLLLDNVYSSNESAEGRFAQIPSEPMAIYKRATASDAKDRYASADAFWHDIENWLKLLPVSAMEGGAAYRTGKAIKRHRIVFSLLTLTVVAVGLASAVAWY